MSLSSKKKLFKFLIIIGIILIILIIRLAYIQFIQGKELQNLAYEQLVKERNINSKRGTIYDSTGKYILAVSYTVPTITINPTNISNENKEKVARKLAEIFELDYDKVLKKVKKQ